MEFKPCILSDFFPSEIAGETIEPPNCVVEDFISSKIVGKTIESSSCLINDLLSTEILYQVTRSRKEKNNLYQIFSLLKQRDLCSCTGWNALVSQSKQLSFKRDALDIYNEINLVHRNSNGSLFRGICVAPSGNEILVCDYYTGIRVLSLFQRRANRCH